MNKVENFKNKELRITSIELVDIINEFRILESESTGKKYVELQHKDFMKKIRKELEVLEALNLQDEGKISLVEYEDKKGEKRPCYSLNRDGMLQILNSESILVRFKTIEYVNKLEEQIKNQAPQLSEKQQCILAIYDGGQGAIQGAKRLSEIEIAEAVAPLEAKIEEQKPLVTFAEQVGDSCDLISVSELAKLANDENLDIGEKRLFQWLRENGYLSDKKVNGNFTNEPYQRFVKQGLFKVIEQTYKTPFGIRLSKKTMITGKGQIYFINKLKDDGRFEHGFGEMLLSS